MLLQTLRVRPGQSPTVVSETPWHDAASNHETYIERLRQYLGGFFETDDTTLQPKKELIGDGTKPIPDAVRVVDDGGQVLASYDVADLQRDTGLRLTAPTVDEGEGT